MDTRDMFAAHAMQVIYGVAKTLGSEGLDTIVALRAYNLADAMMAERNRRRSQRQKPCSPS